MSDYWNSVKIVNADISGNAAKVDTTPLSTGQKAWNNDDDTTIEIDTDKTNGDIKKDFGERAKTLMPPFYKTQTDKVDEETLEWEKEHRKYKEFVRKSPEYKFAMLIAGAANMRIERVWNTNSENPKLMTRGGPRAAANESGDSFLNAAPVSDDLSNIQAFQHRWTQVPEVSMNIHLSPQVYFQVQESLNMVQRHPKGTNASVKWLIAEPTRRTLFAGLVAINIKFSNFMSGLNYQLDRNFSRLKRERKFQLIRIIAELKKNKPAFR